MIYVELFFASFIAFSISTLCGGGAGVLLIPVLGFSLPVTLVPAALTIGTASNSISRIWLFFGDIQWNIVKWFLPAALPGVVLGSWLLSYLNPMYLELCMGLFLVSNLPQIIRKQHPTLANHPPPKWQISVTGFSVGLVSGLTGAVGVLFNRFYFRIGMTNEQILATRAANETLIHLIKLYLYASLGLLTSNAFLIGLIVAIAAVLSTNFMKAHLSKIAVSTFRYIGYSAMVICGVLMLNSAIVRIKLEHNPEIKIQYLVTRGFDASLTLKDLMYSIEFKYEEGFEFEKIVAMPSLPVEKQALVLSQQGAAIKTVVEKVYTIRSISYEAYFYDAQNNLVKKIKFA